MSKTKTSPKAMQYVSTRGSNASSTTTAAYDGWLDTVTYGDNWPNWKQRLAKSLDCTTSLNGTRFKVEANPGLVKSEFDNKSPSCVGGITWHKTEGHYDPRYYATVPKTVQSATISAATNKALSKLVTGIYEAQTTFAGGVALGELGETLRMIRRPAKALLQSVDRYISNLKKGYKTVPRRQRRRWLSETWLEYMFGWRPLVMDIRDGISAATNLVSEQRYPVVQVRASGVVEENVPQPTLVYTFGDGGKEYYTMRDTRKAIVTFRAWVETRPAGLSKLADFGLDPFRDFLPTAWELVPFSFLIDYFVNVNDVINALAIQRTGVRFTNTTTVKLCELERLGGRITPPVSVCYKRMVSSVPYQWRGSWSQVARSQYFGSLVPDFMFRCPDSSSLRWVNILALARVRGLTPFF